MNNILQKKNYYQVVVNKKKINKFFKLIKVLGIALDFDLINLYVRGDFFIYNLDLSRFNNTVLRSLNTQIVDLL